MENKRQAVSVEKNMLLNTLRVFVSIVFPLIVYPYITRVLGVDNFGKVNYGLSIVEYFSLIAALGVATYAAREGGIYRSNKDKLSRFSSEVFSLNVISTVAAYVCLAVFLLCCGKVKDVAVLIAIQSASILLTTLSIEWLNVICEDYAYITLRSFAAQLLSLILVFLAVKSPEDYYLYAIITVATNAVIMACNWAHLRKYVKIRLTFSGIRQHLKPTFILFSNALAINVYLNADTVMLGWILGEFAVGIYSAAAKIYFVFKRVVNAIYMVAITRLTEYYHTGKIEEFRDLMKKIGEWLLLAIVPITVGLAIMAKSVVFLIAGEKYLSGVPTLQILAAAIPFACLAGYLFNCYHLPLKQEKLNLIATCVAAVENIVLNLWFIPAYHATGAAITTLLAEMTVFAILLIGTRKHPDLIAFKSLTGTFLKCVVAALPILLFANVFSRCFADTSVWYLLLTFVCSAVSYVGLGVALKNSAMTDLLKKITKKS